jgi:hypothetical protein
MTRSRFGRNQAVRISSRSAAANVAKDESFCQKVEYIRYNPVRAGLGSEPEDWPYVYFHDDQLFTDQGEFTGGPGRTALPHSPCASQAR